MAQEYLKKYTEALKQGRIYVLIHYKKLAKNRLGWDKASIR